MKRILGLSSIPNLVLKQLLEVSFTTSILPSTSRRCWSSSGAWVQADVHCVVYHPQKCLAQATQQLLWLKSETVSGLPPRFIVRLSAIPRHTDLLLCCASAPTREVMESIKYLNQTSSRCSISGLKVLKVTPSEINPRNTPECINWPVPHIPFFTIVKWRLLHAKALIRFPVILFSIGATYVLILSMSILILGVPILNFIRCRRANIDITIPLWEVPLLEEAWEIAQHSCYQK